VSKGAAPTKLLWTRPRLMCVAVLATGATAWVWFAQTAWTSRYWQNQLVTATDEEAPALVNRIAELGDKSVAILVFGLASPREGVRREARLALDDKLNLWARLPREQASGKLRILAAALAEHSAEFEPTSQLFAADLVTRILLWPTDGNVVERAQLVADCEQTLRARKPGADQIAGRWRRDRDAVRSALVAADLQPSSLPIVTANPPPFDALEAPDLPPLQSSISDARSPQAIAASEPPRKLTVDHTGARRLTAGGAAPHAAANQAAYVADDVEQVAWTQSLDGANAANSAGGLRDQEALELFARLSQSASIAAAAESELKRRGFSRREIEAGKHLTSKDADERRRWAEALPGMRGVDAKSWLLWLSRDEHAVIRRTAVTLMATSQDPQLLRRVEQVAREDADPDTRAQAARFVAANSDAGASLPSRR
jgi:hypothetical protein